MTLPTTSAIPHHLKSALYWFVDFISKGLLDNKAWDFHPLEDFDSQTISWDKYIATITHPTIIKTAFTIWMNNIRMNEDGTVENEEYAAFRAFQCLRPHFDPRYSHDDIVPPFSDEELAEAQW